MLRLPVTVLGEVNTDAQLFVLIATAGGAAP